MAKWIWYPGDFELYHAMLVNNRREKRGMFYSPMWRVDAPNRNMRFYKIAVLEKPEFIRVIANSPDTELVINGTKHPINEKIKLEPGRNFIKVSVFAPATFPCVYCEGETFASDESWMTATFGAGDKNVGTNEMYISPDDDPTVFKFSYKTVYPVSSERVKDGTLYDFGKELMGKLVLESAGCPPQSLFAVYGESRAEALDPENAEINERFEFTGEKTTLRSRACRYVYIGGDCGGLDVSYEYEYLPIEYKGKFECDDELINKIWQISRYTFELNTREAYFDGIKRDRWIWAGDAYQSYFVNFYLTGDKDTVRRTTKMLRGTGKMYQHINTIVDYTLYWIIGIWDYYYFTGDKDFVRDIFPETKEIWELIYDRVDERGYIIGNPKKGDWTFVDWADTANRGTVCAEQILLCAAYSAFAKICRLLGKDEGEYQKKADELAKNITRDFWREEKGAFVDCIDNEERVDVVTRHANIFALRYGVADEHMKKRIIECVIKNDAIPRITTPYFEFFELDAMCEIGETDYFSDMLHSYWGGMVKLGATTFWEEFDPTQQGNEHFEMYSNKFGRSLCHAWASSPIYLLGKYVLGVRPTSAAYKTFDVVPNTLGLNEISGRVPVLDGYVDVKMNNGTVEVLTDVEGGTLVIGKKRIPLTAGKAVKADV
ncbi:MAG: hypothetical protein IJR55_05885 [Clostridia bacterium]|nr:hypothetical protein [Clostridia bacterium]